MKNLLSLFLFILVTGRAWSQGPDYVGSPTNKVINISDKVIFLKQTNWVSVASGATTNVNYSFKVGEKGEEVSAGFLGGGLRPFLSSNPRALAELDKFSSKRSTSMVGYTGVFAGLGVAMAIGLNKTKDNGDKTINPPALIGIGMMITGLIVGGSNYFGASQYMYNAIDIYNSDLINGKGQFGCTLYPSIINKGGTMNAAVSW